MRKRTRAPKKEIFGWGMFDFANQAYTLLIITVVFSVLFTEVIVGSERLGNLLWGIALSISYLMVVFSAPLLGAIMDFSSMKKRFLFGSYIVTVVSSALLYFVEPGAILLGMVLIVFSNYAYSMGESFIASFLPDLGPAEDLGKISGIGWAMGYLGGLLSAGFVLLFLGAATHENFDRIRWVGPFAGFFFCLAAIPTFLWVREPRQHRLPAEETGFFSVGWKRLLATWANVRPFQDLIILLVSIFFTMAGIYIVITYAFIYGAQVVGWDETTRNLMFVVVQVTAALGALLFGLVQDRIGAKITYISTLFIWIVAIGAIYGTPAVTAWLNSTFTWKIEGQQIFLIAGCLAGISLGSSQSAGRALVGIFSPESKAAEFFGFWGVFSKLAAAFGVMGLAMLQVFVGLQTAILFCAVLFAAAIVGALFVNQSRGQHAAETYDKQKS